MVHSDVLLYEFGIPPALWPQVRLSWARRDTDFIGRLDLLWDGEGEPKLAEYNADTPTVLVEAADAQREWCRAVHPDKGQFNVLPEALEAGWRAIAAEISTHLPPDGQPVSAPSLVIAAQGVVDGTRVGAGVAPRTGLFSRVAAYNAGTAIFSEESATATYMAERAATAAAALRQV